MRFVNFILGHIILNPLVSSLYNAICSPIFSTKLMHFSNVSYTGLDINTRVTLVARLNPIPYGMS